MDICHHAGHNNTQRVLSLDLIKDIIKLKAHAKPIIKKPVCNSKLRHAWKGKAYSDAFQERVLFLTNRQAAV
jgi:hypothetical protein